jgi:hypothetical protein
MLRRPKPAATNATASPTTYATPVGASAAGVHHIHKGMPYLRKQLAFRQSIPD